MSSKKSSTVIREIVEPSSPSKKKRGEVAQRRASTPPPGSPAYKDLPAVNMVLATMQGLSATGDSLTFGSQGSHLSATPSKDKTVQRIKQSAQSPHPSLTPQPTQQRTKLMLGICPSLTDKLMPLHIWGVMGAAVSGWALGIPQDQPENTFWAGHSGIRDITRIPARNCLFWLAIRDTTRIPTRTNGSGCRWAFGIQPNNQPEHTFPGQCSGYHPKPARKHILAGHSGIRDTTQIPTRKDGSGWAFGIQPNNQPEQTFSGWCSGYYPKTSQKTLFGLAFRISPEYQPENTFGLGV
ncbi:hypothetical protein BYT27DRAFT_7337312 [Phlegmacium glaucopus]|nr:hypothetical protein BYT27DRAFT_7337312 [Phlegmacium glaucopus]